MKKYVDWEEKYSEVLVFFIVKNLLLLEALNLRRFKDMIEYSTCIQVDSCL
jgi:hypothetical protein